MATITTHVPTGTYQVRTTVLAIIAALVVVGGVLAIWSAINLDSDSGSSAGAVTEPVFTDAWVQAQAEIGSEPAVTVFTDEWVQAQAEIGSEPAVTVFTDEWVQAQAEIGSEPAVTVFTDEWVQAQAEIGSEPAVTVFTDEWLEAQAR